MTAQPGNIVEDRLSSSIGGVDVGAVGEEEGGQVRGTLPDGRVEREELGFVGGVEGRPPLQKPLPQASPLPVLRQMGSIFPGCFCYRKVLGRRSFLSGTHVLNSHDWKKKTLANLPFSS